MKARFICFLNCVSRILDEWMTSTKQLNLGKDKNAMEGFRFVHRASFGFCTFQCWHKLMKCCLSINRVQVTCRIGMLWVYIITFLLYYCRWPWSKSNLLLASKRGCDFALFLRGYVYNLVVSVKTYASGEFLTTFRGWGVARRRILLYFLYI